MRRQLPENTLAPAPALAVSTLYKVRVTKGPKSIEGARLRGTSQQP